MNVKLAPSPKATVQVILGVSSDLLPELSATHRQTEHGAVVAAPTVVCCAVELSIGALHQSRNRIGAIGAMTLWTEAIERGHRPIGSHFEDGALGVCPAPVRGPIEVSIASLNQRPGWSGAIRLVEDVQQRERAALADFESSAGIETVVRPPGLCCPVEVSIGTLDQRPLGVATIPAGEVVQWRERAARGDFKERPAAVESAPASCSVETSIANLDQAGDGERAVDAKPVYRGELAERGYEE